MLVENGLIWAVTIVDFVIRSVLVEAEKVVCLSESKIESLEEVNGHNTCTIITAS